MKEDWRCNTDVYKRQTDPGLGLMVNGQVPNPNYFEAYLKIIGIKINFKIGESCPL